MTFPPSSPGIQALLRSPGGTLAAFVGFCLTGLVLLSGEERSAIIGDGGSSASAGRLAAASASSSAPAVLPAEYCVVHVHGFHHSGTGVARHFLNESFGKELSSDMWYDRGEAEGHNAQHVYSCDKVRGKGKGLCLGTERDASKMWGRIWYCPIHVKNVMEEAKRVESGKALWDEWAPTWDLSKPYLIQKSPMFDVELLDRLNIQEFSPQALATPGAPKGGTFHVVVMRHPFMAYAYFDYMYTYEHLLFNWLDTWEHVLGLFASGTVQKFAVVQYEMMANRAVAPLIKEELKALVREGCGIEPLAGAAGGAAAVGDLAESGGQMRRRLEYHENGGVSERHLRIAGRFVHHCKKDVECNKLRQDLQPIVAAFGYNLNDLEGFHADASPIMFSYKNPPSQDLVRRLRALVKKHIGNGNPRWDPRNPRYAQVF